MTQKPCNLSRLLPEGLEQASMEQISTSKGYLLWSDVPKTLKVTIKFLRMLSNSGEPVEGVLRAR